MQLKNSIRAVLRKNPEMPQIFTNKKLESSGK
jgi:hypothetical protein